MRIVFHSNAPWNNSGYGIQTALFVPRIASLGHEILISAPYSFGASVLEWEDFTVFGCSRDNAGNDTLISTYEYFNADLLITLCDPFGLMKCASGLQQLNTVMWFPVDTNPLGEGDVAVLRESEALPIAMSTFGAGVLRSEGADPLYVPHGVNTKIFRPGDPQSFRDTIPQIGDDTFVIGMCAMNRDTNRKGISEQMLAFAGFHARHPDSVLALHTAPVNNPGLNLHGMAARLGISGAVVFPDEYTYEMGIITGEQMATWYNGLDLLSMCSYGEGFGLPLIEAQACGIPVITTNAASMAELCGAGWTVSGTPFWAPGHGAWWIRPDVTEIEQGYEMAFQSREQGNLPKKQAREFAMCYDADRVFKDFWVPCLKDLENRITEAA